MPVMLYTAAETRSLLEEHGVLCLGHTEGDDQYGAEVEIDTGDDEAPSAVVETALHVQVLSTGGWFACRADGEGDEFRLVSMPERHSLDVLIEDLRKLRANES